MRLRIKQQQSNTGKKEQPKPEPLRSKPRKRRAAPLQPQKVRWFHDG
jgi:hypothetical protein